MTNQELLAKLLQGIEPWDTTEVSDETLKLAVQFIEQNSDVDLTEAAFEHIEADVEAWRVGALFDVLVWEVDDGGEALTKSLEAWLVSEDVRKIEWALAPKGWYPFSEAADMARAFDDIKKKRPDLAQRCNEITARRERMMRLTGK